MATQTAPPQPAQTPAKQANPLSALQGLLEKHKGQIAMALPRHMTPERMIRVALTAMSQSPKLQLCDPLTVCGAVVQSSILGLEPNAVLGEAFLVPYKNNKRLIPGTNRKGVYECQLQIGYKGHIKLARNSGEIGMIDAQLVFANDEFDFEKGADPWLKHKWGKTGARGEVIGCWAGFKTKDGVFNFEYMTAEEIIEHRDRFTKSTEYNSETGLREIYGPWIDNPEWMWKKTPLIKVLKLAPKSVHVATAIALTEMSETGTQQRFSIDVPLELHPPANDEDDAPKGEQPQRASQQQAQPAATATASPAPAPAAAAAETPKPAAAADALPEWNSLPNHAEWPQDAVEAKYGRRIVVDGKCFERPDTSEDFKPRFEQPGDGKPVFGEPKRKPK